MYLDVSTRVYILILKGEIMGLFFSAVPDGIFIVSLHMNLKEFSWVLNGIFLAEILEGMLLTSRPSIFFSLSHISGISNMFSAFLRFDQQ